MSTACTTDVMEKSLHVGYVDIDDGGDNDISSYNDVTGTSGKRKMHESDEDNRWENNEILLKAFKPGKYCMDEKHISVKKPYFQIEKELRHSECGQSFLGTETSGLRKGG